MPPGSGERAMVPNLSISIRSKSSMNRLIEPPKDGKAFSRSIDVLQQVTSELLSEVKALASLKIVKMDSEINFNHEVQSFEIYLIERALEKTGGNQTRAARLLQLKHTTLNSKIKRFKIRTEEPSDFDA
jgi:transcriptional regulator with GAF, ATPase, and Fis domain